MSTRSTVRNPATMKTEHRMAPAPGLQALLAYGFRPFFLLAGLYAVIAVPVWIASLVTGIWPMHGLPPVAWHAHEMLFGFIVAAIAGFMLTAVPNWTGRAGYAGRPLALLAGLWLVGRLALLPWLGVPALAAAVIDLVFLPALAATLAPALIRAGRLRNLPFLVMLTGLFAANLLFHLDHMGYTRITADIGLILGTNVVLVMIVVIGGRIVPAFTLNTLRRQGRPREIAPRPWIDRLAIILAVGILVVDIAAPGGTLAGAIALATGLALLVRASRWHGHRTLHDPILWVLHLGYAWVSVALLLKGIWLLTGWIPASGWLHALTIGGFGTMILAVMSRAALGHTGREIRAGSATTAAYLSVTGAALVRVFGDTLTPLGAIEAASVTAVLWVAAFALFSLAFWPVLTRPRADGKPG